VCGVVSGSGSACAFPASSLPSPSHQTVPFTHSLKPTPTPMHTHTPHHTHTYTSMHMFPPCLCSGANLDVDVPWKWLNFFLEDDARLAQVGW
jgi:hypothetical protein